VLEKWLLPALQLLLQVVIAAAGTTLRHKRNSKRFSIMVAQLFAANGKFCFRYLHNFASQTRWASKLSHSKKCFFMLTAPMFDWNVNWLLVRRRKIIKNLTASDVVDLWVIQLLDVQSIRNLSQDSFTAAFLLSHNSSREGSEVNENVFYVLHHHHPYMSHSLSLSHSLLTECW